ncbi:MAG: NADH-quinone oxidoreductase subunit NuoE [Eubacteriales bacterium]
MKNNNNESNSIEIIDKIVSQANVTEGSNIIILQKIQEEFGYISPTMLERISQLIGTSVSELNSIITFYTQFRLEPIGKHLIQVCHGTACHLAGAEKISDAIELETGAKAGSTSPDGLFTIENVSCLGCCSIAPVIKIDDETYGKVTPEKVRNIIKEIRTMDNQAQTN